MAEKKAEKKPMDLIERGVYGSSPLGTAIFVGYVKSSLFIAAISNTD
jgi:hypothetical protein